MSPIIQVTSFSDESVEIDLENMTYDTAYKISSFVEYLPIKKVQVGYAVRELLNTRIKSMSIDRNVIFEVFTDTNGTKSLKKINQDELSKWCLFIIEQYKAMVSRVNEVLRNPQANMEEYNAIVASKEGHESNGITFQGGSSQKQLKNKSKKQLGGAKTKTDKHIMVGNVKRCVYEGPKGGKYVKQNGEFVSITAVKKK